ncbi:hypothetical protein [Micromonospora sp. HM5-17]|nr:hypothetical protein [Micromonospora sp. HM5-17]
MLRLFRRRSPVAGVRFCDGCAEVTTAEQRVRRRYDRDHTDLYPLILPR